MSDYTRRWARTALGSTGPGNTRLAGSPGLPSNPTPLREGKPSPTQQAAWRSDRKRVFESPYMARLQGVTQVVPGPGTHSNRLSHSIEVSLLAEKMAVQLGLNPDLAAAIALAHDFGHAPFGHVGEEIVQRFVPEFCHADWSARLVQPYGLSPEVMNGIGAHSWSRPRPATPEGEIVRWADRIAYLPRDFADACLAGLITPETLDPAITTQAGSTLAEQRDTFCADLVETSRRHGVVCMSDTTAKTMARYRTLNLAQIYTHPRLRAVGEEAGARLLSVLRAMVGRPPVSQADRDLLIHKILQLTDQDIVEMSGGGHLGELGGEEPWTNPMESLQGDSTPRALFQWVWRHSPSSLRSMRALPTH